MTSGNIWYRNRPVGLESNGWLQGTLTQGSKGLGVKKPNGKFLSVDPSGNYSERDDVNGSYEIVMPDASMNLLRVTPGTEVNQVVPYAIVYHG